MALLNDDVNQDEPELPKIGVSSIGKGGYWAGMSAGEAKSIYRGLHELGTLSSANYIVELEPYKPDSQIADIDWFQEFSWLPWLATSCSLPLLDAQVDSVQAGHHQQNFITGKASGDIPISFLETKEGDILNTVQHIKNIMFNPDGTQGLPYHYMLWLTVSLFPRHNRKITAYSERMLVALQVASIDLAASNPNPIEVPLSFTRMFPTLV